MLTYMDSSIKIWLWEKIGVFLKGRHLGSMGSETGNHCDPLFLSSSKIFSELIPLFFFFSQQMLNTLCWCFKSLIRHLIHRSSSNQREWTTQHTTF